MSKENQLEMLALPVSSGALATKTSLKLSEQTTIEQWAETGNMLYQAGQKMSWWLADWAAFGERKYGQLKEFCELNGINYSTISNAATTAKSVESSRRRELLSFSHHVEVSALKPKDQSRFLKMAEAEKLSVSELRKRIRQWQGEFGPEKTHGPEPQIFSLEKFFLDGEVFLERNTVTLVDSRDYLWEKAQPMLARAAQIWPEKVSLK